MGSGSPGTTIRDDRGVDRPLWHFPHAKTGVPEGCPLLADEQYAIEKAIGAPMCERTALPDPLLRRLIPLVGCLIGGFAIRPWFPASSAELYFSPVWLLVVGIIFQYLDAVRLALAWGGSLALVYAVDRAAQSSWLPLPVFFLPALIGCSLAMLPRWVWLSPLSRRGRWAAHPLRIRAAMLERDRCPSCAHPVRPLSERTRAWLTCVHCSALWRAPGYAWPREAWTPRDCPKCRYCLAGLPADEDLTIQCPECGFYIPAPPTRGRIADDRGGSLRCWGCGRSLGGLPLRYGDRVQCPDCGQWRSGLTAADVATPSEPRG